VSARDVGYAGRKDRHAITRQWFSLPEIDPERALEFGIDDVRVLEAARHEHKLKTGHLRANRFEIVLRGSGVPIERIEERAAELVRRGMPNRYGSQRFGRDGDNADRARAMLESGRAPRDRRAGRFLISALQSEVFNAVLDERIETYDSVVLGDLARVEESGGLFWVDDLERESQRAADFEISATGPIFGTRARAPRDEAGLIEQRVFERFGVSSPAALRLPRGIRARGGRRPLRVRPTDLQVAVLGTDSGISIGCELPSGSYVTVLIECLVGPVVDGSRGVDGATSDSTDDSRGGVYPGPDSKRMRSERSDDRELDAPPGTGNPRG
jgi:tRNA pseudouridine13 synthase